MYQLQSEESYKTVQAVHSISSNFFEVLFEVIGLLTIGEENDLGGDTVGAEDEAAEVFIEGFVGRRGVAEGFCNCWTIAEGFSRGFKMRKLKNIIILF